MPQDMSRPFLITLERLAFITVLSFPDDRLDPTRQDREQDRIEFTGGVWGCQFSGLRERSPG